MIYYLTPTFRICRIHLLTKYLVHNILAATQQKQLTMQNNTNTNPPPPQAMNTSHPSSTSPAANTWISIANVTNLIINPTNTIGITADNPKRKETQ
jgi:hypothetical protein